MKSFFIALVILCGTPSFAYGAIAETINAQVLPTIWYSSLTAQAGDTVGIYAGIQNDSNTAFAGIATFYIDGIEVQAVSFQSKIGGVEKVGTTWSAVAGQSSIQVKISADLDASKKLVSYQSDVSSYKVERKLTVEVVTALVKDTVTDVAGATAEKLDTVTGNLSTQLEAYKKPEVATNGSVANDTANTGGVAERVLGTTTIGNLVASKNVGSFIDKAQNMGLNALQFLLLQWRWTLAGLGVLSLAFVFLKK